MRPTVVPVGEGTAATVHGTVKVGDIVHVAAKVTRLYAGDRADIYIYGASSDFDAAIRTDQIVAVEVPNPPAEPVDGSWVPVERDDSVGAFNVFIRIDSATPADDGERRWPRRWLDVAGGADLVDWPTVVARGGDPADAFIRHPTSTT